MMENIKIVEREGLRIEVNYDGVKFHGKINDMKFTGVYNEVIHYISKVIFEMYKKGVYTLDEARRITFNVINMEDVDEEILKLIPKVGKYKSEEIKSFYDEWDKKFDSKIKPNLNI